LLFDQFNLLAHHLAPRISASGTGVSHFNLGRRASETGAVWISSPEQSKRFDPLFSSSPANT
jgi:hypothetical protein